MGKLAALRAIFRVYAFGSARRLHMRLEDSSACEGSTVMHVRANPINPNAQLDALYAAEKAAAKRAAESTRKKLLEFALELAGEADSEEACVVELGAREEAEEQAAQQENPRDQSSKKSRQPWDAENADGSISDWA
jgi:hypothetical protein